MNEVDRHRKSIIKVIKAAKQAGRSSEEILAELKRQHGSEVLPSADLKKLQTLINTIYSR